MAWYSDNFLQRKAITVINTAGATPMDSNVVFPEDWDEFWDTIDEIGEELRITQADGFSLVDYTTDDGAGGTFSAAAKTGRVQIDGIAVSATAGEAVLFWVYFDTVAAAGDASTVTTITSAETGHIDLGSPTGEIAPVQRARVDATRPPTAFAKDSNETYHVWLDLSPTLERRATPYAGRRLHEEVRRAVYDVVDDTGASQAGTMITTGSVRFVELADLGGNERRMFARVPIKAGTSGEKYTLRADFTTNRPPNTAHRILRGAVGFAINDLLET